MKTAEEWNTRRWVLLAMQGLVITVIVSGFVLLFTSSGETLRQLRQEVRWPLVPLLAVPVLLSWTFSGTRFYLMSRCIGQPLPFLRAWAIAVSFEFGIAASPGGIGGTAVRLGFLKKSGISFVHGGTLMAADMFIDILFFTLITPFAGLILLHQLHANRLDLTGEWNPLWLLAVVIPVILYLCRKPLYQRLCNYRYFKKYRLRSRIRLMRKNLVQGFRKGRTAMALIFKEHRGMVALNFLLSALQITSRYSVLPLAIWMLGITANPLPLILIQGVLFMISMMVVAPGGGGSVEVLAALALPQLMPMHLVGVAILLWRIFTYHFYLLAGGIVFAATFRRLMKN